MLPRRCKKCKCYIAPQLDRCPRCRKKAPPLATKPTKEDKQNARAKRDAKTPTIQAKNIHWIPSALTLRAQQQQLEILRRKLERADTAAARNAIRCEIRLAKATLARATVPNGKKGWTYEIFRTKHTSVPVFVAPSKHRYVRAEKDAHADLIMLPRKKKDSPVRLVRFEKSPYQRMLKRERHEDTQHKARTKAKKKHRAEKRKAAPRKS